jgi:hypothetical protein
MHNDCCIELVCRQGDVPLFARLGFELRHTAEPVNHSAAVQMIHSGVNDVIVAELLGLHLKGVRFTVRIVEVDRVQNRPGGGSVSDSIRVGHIVRKRREELGLSQAKLSRALGIVSSEFVCLVESGKRSFALNNLPRVAEVLSLDAADLCRCGLYEAAPRLYLATFGEAPPDRPKPIINR